MIQKLQRSDASTQRPIKVLQFGEGNFLRAFADWIIDVMNEKTSFNGAIEIVQPIENGLSHKINDQQGLYHTVLNGIRDGKPEKTIRLITSVVKAHNPYQDYAGFLRLAENPDLKIIISNTTEAGITFNEKDTANTLPVSFPGKLTQLLYRRFQYNASSELCILPCELIEKNGDELRTVIFRYIAHWQLPDAFKQWVTEKIIFCNTLVDRIVPGFPKETIHSLWEETGYEDNLTVMAEVFHLWVIEGDERVKKIFPADQAGLHVKFVKDLTPYRTRKVRILNGAHTALVPVSYLSGLRTVRDSMDDSFVRSFTEDAIFNEIIPTLDLPVEELREFATDVIERFQNPFIKHELLSIALNSVSKYKVRVLPSVLQYTQQKKELPGKLMFSLAALIRFYKGEWRGETIPLNDTPDVLDFFKGVWTTNDLAAISKKVLSNTDLWDQDLSRLDGAVETITRYLKQIEAQEKSQVNLAL